MSTDTAGVFSASRPTLGSFLNVVEAKKVTKSSKEEPKFSGNFELDADNPDLAGARATIAAVARAKWPSLNIGEAIKAGTLLVPLASGDKLADKAAADNANPAHKNYRKDRLREWSRGKQVLTARSQFQPNLSYVENGRLVELADQAAVVQARSKFDTGKQVLFQVNFVAYDAVGEGKPGVTAYLNMVCSTGVGEKLISGGPSAAEVFKGYMGLESTEDPTGGASDTNW